MIGAIARFFSAMKQGLSVGATDSPPILEVTFVAGLDNDADIARKAQDEESEKARIANSAAAKDLALLNTVAPVGHEFVYLGAPMRVVQTHDLVIVHGAWCISCTTKAALVCRYMAASGLQTITFGMDEVRLLFATQIAEYEANQLKDEA